MRENQINKRTAGKKNNPVKDQTAGSFSPPPAILSCLDFSPIYTYIPRVIYASTMPSHFAHFSHPSSRQLHLNSLYKFQVPVIFFFSIFSPSPPSTISFFDFMAGHIFNLAPLSPLSDAPLLASLPPSSSLPRSFPHSLQCRTKWRLMKGGRCVCHPDSLMQPPQQVLDLFKTH